MSWPTDGEPRFITASIHGSHIGWSNGGGLDNMDEHYVYDRARCHRVVYREQGTAPALLAVTDYCDLLNRAQAGWRGGALQ